MTPLFVTFFQKRFQNFEYFQKQHKIAHDRHMLQNIKFNFILDEGGILTLITNLEGQIDAIKTVGGKLTLT